VGGEEREREREGREVDNDLLFYKGRSLTEDCMSSSYRKKRL
jgi:hypothetical protein